MWAVAKQDQREIGLKRGESDGTSSKYLGPRTLNICLKMVCSEVITEALRIHDISERD